MNFFLLLLAIYLFDAVSGKLLGDGKPFQHTVCTGIYFSFCIHYLTVICFIIFNILFILSSFYKVSSLNFFCFFSIFMKLKYFVDRLKLWR